MRTRTLTATAVGTAVLASAALVGAPTATAAAKPAPGTAFTAYGPTWRAVVSQGRLSIDGPGVTASKVKVTRSAFAKGVEFTGTSRGRSVSLVIRGGRCVDTAGHDTGQRAYLQVGKKKLRGCAVNGALKIAGT